MLDFIVMLSFMFGLFYTGTQYNNIVDFITESATDETILDQSKVTTMIGIAVVLTIIFWPFVLGYNKSVEQK